MIIVINRNIIRSNKKTEHKLPPIRVSKGKYGKPNYFYEYEIKDGLLKYSPHDPLPCGATVWIETDA